MENKKKNTEVHTNGALSNNQPVKSDQEPDEKETEGGEELLAKKDELSGPANDLIAQPKNQ